LLEKIDKKIAEIHVNADLKLDSLPHSKTLSPASTAGLIYTEGVSLIIDAGHIITAARGTVFVCMSNAAAEFPAGAVVDLTEGAVTQTGSAAAGHKYLVLDSAARIMSGAGLEIFVLGWYEDDGNTFPFSDVSPASWYYPAAEYVYRHGYFNGTGFSEFSPSKTMTRAMFVTVLHRLAGNPPPNTSNTALFTDVLSPELYYYGAVQWAASYGIATGYADGSFRPTEEVSREQMAAFFFRYASVSGGPPAYDSSRAMAFPDYSEISDYARDAFGWACAAGIINGTTDGLLMPKANSTRAQVAQVIMNYTSFLS